MVGQSAAMRHLFEKIRLVADTRSTVLITGESGTGKELVARSLHLQSSRSDKPFVPVNCAAIPETLVESELDVRLVAATNRNLKELVDARLFRDDLYFRLKVVELLLPPLRERREDIPLLARHFIERIAKEYSHPVHEITPAALDALCSYDWPGNVRELSNTLEGVIVLSMDEQIELEDLPECIRGAQQIQSLVQPGLALRDIEREAIRRALEQSRGHRGSAARSLGISTRTLQRKVKEYELDF